MQFTTIATVLSLALTAFAAPASEVEARTYTNEPSKTCNNDAKQVCCNGLLTCAVQVLGQGCSSQAYCCNTDAPTGALINVALLNCVQL